MVDSGPKFAVARRRWRRRLLIRLADLFLPEVSRNESADSTLRARVTAIAAFVAGISILGAVYVTTDAPDLNVRRASYGLSIAFLGVPVALRLGLPPAFAQHWLLGLMWLYASFIGLMTGGKDTAAVVVAMLVPFFAILFSGIRIGLWWSLAMAASCIAVSMILASGYPPPVEPDFDAIGAWNLWAAVIGLFLTLGLASAYEWLRSDVERRLRREKLRGDRLNAAQRAIDQRFQTELQALVDERTRDLEATHVELRRAERLASIGTLAAGVAHEINNPIGGILISAQYALANGDSPDREAIWREALVESEQQALRCARIVKALLRFASGSEAVKSRQDLNDIVRSALGAMRGGLSRDEFERIETALTPDPLDVLADPIGLEQVVVNLVRNALEASGGIGIVRVATARAEDGPCLRIEDEGPGIREGDLPRIFDPFFSTREQAGGTGLGLSIVHGIVQDHGGSIDVASAEGRGTCFHVRFRGDAAPVRLH